MRHAVAFTLALLIVSPPAARAEQAPELGLRGWGPRVGLTMGPDQVHFGAHLDFGNLASRVRLQPNVEVGIGDDRTFTAINAEAAYRFNSRWEAWSPYAGGGLGFDIVNFEGVDGSHTDVGMSVLGGIERGLSHGDRFFIEAKLGISDAPDWKFTAGWTFPK